MDISKLNPDEVLASLLDKSIEVKTSATKSHVIRAYGDANSSNRGVDDEHIEIGWNGGARSLTIEPALFRGDLTLTIWCKTLSDGRANKKRISQIVSQVPKLVHRKVSQGFLFMFDPTRVIMPTTTNLVTGHSLTTLNVEWRVTDEFLK